MIKNKKIIALLIVIVAISMICVLSSRNDRTNSNNDANNYIKNSNIRDISNDIFDSATQSTTTASDTYENIESDYNPVGNESIEYPSQNDIFKYNVYETYVEITGSVSKDLSGKLVIPETLEGLPVCSIADNAFGGRGPGFTDEGYSISSVVFPKNLYKIGKQAFYRCKELTSISLNNKLIEIGSLAFSETSIRSVELPDSLEEVGAQIFEGCNKLENVKIGNKLQLISDSMFAGCTELNKIVWGECVRKIDILALSFTGFEKIELPNTIQIVCPDSFSNMDNLTEFVFSDSVTEIGGGALSSCPYLERVTIGRGVSSLPEYLFDDSSLEYLVIPDTVTYIDDEMLGGNFPAKPIIYGEKGTEAASFAASKGLQFKVISE